MRYVQPIDIDDLPTLKEIAASLKPALKTAVNTIRESIENAYEEFDGATPSELHMLLPIGILPESRTALETIFKRRLGEFGALFDALTQHFEDTHNSTCP